MLDQSSQIKIHGGACTRTKSTLKNLPQHFNFFRMASDTAAIIHLELGNMIFPLSVSGQGLKYFCIFFTEWNKFDCGPLLLINSFSFQEFS
jgi:hypothetical protein